MGRDRSQREPNMGNRVDVSKIHSISKWLGLGSSIGVGVAVEVLKRCRGEVGGKAPSILTFTPRLGIGWFVASHGFLRKE